MIQPLDRQNKKDRVSDNDPIRRMWDKYAPYMHVCGFAITCVFIVGMNYSKLEAQAATIDSHTLRLSIVEASVIGINQKLDDLIFFWHIPHRSK